MTDLQEFDPETGHRPTCESRCGCAADLYALAASERHAELVNLLVDERDELWELYDNSPAFHHTLNYFAWMLPYMVAGLAEPARRNDEYRALMVELMEKANKGHSGIPLADYDHGGDGG